MSTRNIQRDAESRSRLLYPDEEWRSALQDIADNPEFHGSTVQYVKKNFVLVKDQKPRASVHLLLLPRGKSKYELHPLTAYSDLPLLRRKYRSPRRSRRKNPRSSINRSPRLTEIGRQIFAQGFMSLRL